MKIIDKKEFAKAGLDKHIEAFVMHMTFLLIIAIHPVKKAQIALLVARKVQILSNYLDFSNVFLEKKVLVLPEATDLNQHIIKLEKGQQPFYRLNYSLGLIKLKIFKIYIKINLVNNFIWPLKLLASAFIFFIQKPDRNFCLYVDY